LKQFIKELKAFLANRVLVAAVSTLICAVLVDFAKADPATVARYAEMIIGIIGIIYGTKGVAAVVTQKKQEKGG
jgi:hypothetical protein